MAPENNRDELLVSGRVPKNNQTLCLFDPNLMVQGGPPTSYKWSYNPYK